MKKSRMKRRPRPRPKRKTFKNRRGGSIVPFILQDTFWSVADSFRDTYNGFAGNYEGVDSSITTQGVP
jgi:hypothetical protein